MKSSKPQRTTAALIGVGIVAVCALYKPVMADHRAVSDCPPLTRVVSTK